MAGLARGSGSGAFSFKSDHHCAASIQFCGDEKQHGLYWLLLQSELGELVEMLMLGVSQDNVRSPFVRWKLPNLVFHMMPCSALSLEIS